jgi:putative intracellular protease/amidase
MYKRRTGHSIFLDDQKRYMMDPEKNLQVAILLYDGMTALDAIGPYEVLQAPTLGTDVRFVAREKA